MVKRILIIIAVGILFLSPILFLPDVETKLGDVDLKIEKGNLWDHISKEPIEKAIVLFRDGSVYILTQNTSNRIVFPVAWFTEKEGKKLSDIVLIIHNHLGIGRFSPDDIELYNYLYNNHGFRGYFLLRLGNGNVIEHRRGE